MLQVTQFQGMSSLVRGVTLNGVRPWSVVLGALRCATNLSVLLYGVHCCRKGLARRALQVNRMTLATGVLCLVRGEDILPVLFLAAGVSDFSGPRARGAVLL